MQTQEFQAAVPRVHGWIIGVAPPVGFIALVQLWAYGAHGGGLAPFELLVIAALTQLLPIGALVWMLCSVAAYSVEPGRIVVRRVIGDRALALDRRSPGPLLTGRVIKVAAGGRTLRVHPEDPSGCLAALRSASG